MNTPPAFASIRFSCPHCGALAHQHWSLLRTGNLEKDKVPNRYDLEALKNARIEQESLKPEDRYSDFHLLDEMIRSTSGELFTSSEESRTYGCHLYNLEISSCDSCGDIALWSQNKMVYPSTGPAGLANRDMPQNVKSIFDEAGAVFHTSPKAAAALLRLALQHLMVNLDQSGKNINSDINNLIDKGLDPDMARMMHSVRIIGNESVHPGVIDVDDEPYVAEIMFDLLNQIVEQMISRPNRHRELWEKLPENKRQEVDRKIDSVINGKKEG